MDLKVKVGSKTVIHSGSIILEKELYEFSMHLYDLNLYFSFRETEDGILQLVRVSSDGKSGRYEMRNANSSTGITFVMDNAITINGRSYDISFFISNVIGDVTSTKLINYTVLEQ
ncbi:hypothetical protein [uncultured Sphingomonas sp.]|uniref:hypothetical protein n=1 Tax=uncultured Sphingomonas sp. TaxID=158754 RepID=UPI00374A20E0